MVNHERRIYKLIGNSSYNANAPFYANDLEVFVFKTVFLKIMKVS